MRDKGTGSQEPIEIKGASRISGMDCSMNLSKTMIGAVVAGFAFVGAGASSANAQELTKGLFQARVLDYCLYDQWAKRKEKDGILKECRCASKAYVAGLDKDALGAHLKSGTLSYNEKKAVLGAHAKCRKK